jgi:SAM-dependent methyltransferase
MNKDLTVLRDPKSGENLTRDGDNLVSSSGARYPIVNGIARFVQAENYSADFGSQWNMFPKTQLDSFSGVNISESRLERCLHGNLKKLKGKRVLEAGSGAGRFTEILLKYGAIVHSFDFSNAVEANARNNSEYDDLVLVQSDIREIPFPKMAYDYVICLGVLQHTPCSEDSIRCLFEMVMPGGALVVDHYPWKWRLVLPTPIGESISLYRNIILRLSRQSRFKIVKKITDFWFPYHWYFRDSLLTQRILRRFSPVIFHYPDIKLKNRQMYYEWALLDTHDATTDFFKHRRTVSQIHATLEALGGRDLVVQAGGNGVEAFCRRAVE